MVFPVGFLGMHFPFHAKPPRTSHYDLAKKKKGTQGASTLQNSMPVLIPAFSAKPIHPSFPILQQVCGTFMDILYSFAMKYSSAS